MEWAVDPVERDVEEKGFGFVSGFNEPAGFVGHQVGGVSGFLQRCAISVPVGVGVALVREIVQSTEEVAILVVGW